MPQIFLSVAGLRSRCIITSENDTLSSLFDSQVCALDAYITKNGKLQSWDDTVEDGQTYHVVPRVLGGKGGFGSMLRALGAQIEKTTNREACRDISGRRMRDVNNEQKLRDWVAKASDREREKEQKRRERWERRRAEPRHVFDDPEYARQKMQVAEGLEDALQQGLQKASTSATTTSTVTRKRKSEEPGPSGGKKAALEWLGVDNISDLDTDSDSDEDVEPFTDCHVPQVGPSAKNIIPDSGAVSGASSHTSEYEEHSDSGVESVPDHRPKSGSPMDVDSDSSAKDSAMNSDTDVGLIHNVQHSTELMQMDSPVKNSCSPDPGEGISRQHGLLEALEAHKPQSEKPAEVPVQVNPEEVDLMTYQSATELEALGLETLKAVLMHKGMKCGGTLQQRAERLWAARGLESDQIHPSLLAKPQKGKKK